jgi:preprotein translocase subunit YajC
MNFKSIKKIIAVVSCVMVLCFMFAGCATTGTADATGTTSSSGAIQSVLMIVALFAVFYFLMIRPESKKKKKAEEMRNSLGVGDEVITIGGIKGKVVNMSSDTITFETGEDRVRVEVAKWAISTKGK